MAEFVKVATVSSIPDPGRTAVEVDDRVVALFHVDGSFYCTDDVCTHDGGPLGDGPTDGFQIVCPRHGARFDMRTGKALTMPATQPVIVHEVRVEGDDILVRQAPD